MAGEKLFTARKGEWKGHALAVFEAEVVYTKKGETIKDTVRLQFGKDKALAILDNLGLVADVAGVPLGEVLMALSARTEAQKA